MSNPEELVPSLETCKAMKEAGIAFDSYLCWVCTEKMGDHVERRESFGDYTTTYSAPTAQEILEKIPGGIVHKNTECDLITCHHGLPTVMYDWSDIVFEHKNLAEAAAQMILWAKEAGYLK